MNPAMNRRTTKESHPKVANPFQDEPQDENVQAVGNTGPSEVSLRIIRLEHDFDDLSTIADDTIMGHVPSVLVPQEHDPRTPPLKRKIPFGNDNDEEDTQPETPPKHDPYEPFGNDPHYWTRKGWSPRFLRLFIAASILGSILLGSIAVMSATLYQLRNGDNNNSNGAPMFSEDGDSLFGRLDPSPTQMPTKTPTVVVTSNPLPPTQAPIAPVSNPVPTQKETPTPTTTPRSPTDLAVVETSEPTQQPTLPLPPTEIPQEILTLAEELLSVEGLASFYSSSSSVLTQPNSVQYSVLEWMSADPFLETYSPEKLVQRYALSVMYSGFSFEEGHWTTDTWMTYTDECNWVIGRGRDICEFTGTVSSIYLEDIGFNGTLASEIGLLSGLQRFFLAANHLKGPLPSEIGLLQELQRLNLPRNRFTGSLPTEIGQLSNLENLVIGRNLFSGNLPTELGNLQKLNALELQRSYYVGSIPDEIGNLSALTSLRLEINGLSGAVPSSLVNLANLETFRLENNNIKGAVPQGFCSQNRDLEFALVDCDEVICSCCQGCKNQKVEIEEPPPSDQDCAPYVLTPKDCYAPGDSIPVETSTCQVEDSHVIALYEAEALARFGFRNPLFWLSLCDEEVCLASIADGFLLWEDGTSDRFAITPSTLEGEYVVVVVNVQRPGSIELLAESPPFQVGDCKK